MSALVYLLLGLTMGGLCLWLWPRRQPISLDARGAVNAALVALALGAFSSLLLATGPAGGDTLSEVQQMLGLAARFMSLPLIALASLQLARGQHWRPVVWGRIVIGLMLFFQLSRMVNAESVWLWLITLASLFAIGGAAWFARSDKRIALLWLVSSICVLAPAILNGNPPLVALLHATLQASWLIPAFVAAGLTVGLLAEQAHNKQHNHATPDQTTATHQ